MDPILPSKFYGDSYRWFVGTVEDVDDPVRLGRVRVRVRGLHSPSQADVDTSELPWAQVSLPTTEGGVSGIGRSTGLLPGAHVFGFFLDGEGSQLPVVTGTYSLIEYGSSSGLRGSSGGGYGSTGEKNRLAPEAPFKEGSAGTTNAETAWNFFVANGFTPEQASGIVGNLMVESRFNTSVKSAGSEQSFGIAQWNAAGGRFQNLKAFAADIGQAWTDLDTQLRFVLHELRTVPSYGLGALQSTSTIEDATATFMRKFERPGVPHLDARIAYAREAYKRFNS